MENKMYHLLRSLLFVLLMSLSSVGVANDLVPGWYITKTDLDLHKGPSKDSVRITTVDGGIRMFVLTTDSLGWSKVVYNGDTLYAVNKYLESAPPLKTAQHRSILSTILLWSFFIGSLIVSIVILRFILLLCAEKLSTITYHLYWIISMPFYILNWLQRWLAKPWMYFYKYNKGTDESNYRLRLRYEKMKIPLYILLTPIRFINACYYNLVVHLFFEAFNYCLEVIIPTKESEGDDSTVRWFIMLPWRIIKYPLWHGALTLIECCVWTIVDTFIPALTLFHGTSYDAGISITQSRGRVGDNSNCIEVWNVGGGNFAGNGIYFAPERSTALHYSTGVLIVCRVSLGRTLDLGLAPKRIFDLCGHSNALGVTKWGLNHKYVTGEWWRGSNAKWWEYCMYDWQNRYNQSWRIRPLFLLDLDEHTILRTPGGMYHWLFRKMVFADLKHDYKKS